MREHDSRIAIRLPKSEREQAEQLIQRGRFKNLSTVIRVALKELLSKEGDQLA